MEQEDQQLPAPVTGGKKNLIIKIAVISAVVLVLATLAVAFWNRSGIKSNTATLSWEDNTEPDLAGYKIYYGISPRTGDCPPAGYLNKVDAGKTTTPDNPTYTLKDLENNKTYYFSITSYDATGNESCFSQEMSKAMSAAK